MCGDDLFPERFPLHVISDPPLELGENDSRGVGAGICLEMKRSNSGCFACFGGGLDLEEPEAGKWDEATHSRVQAGNMPAQPAWKSLKAGANAAKKSMVPYPGRKKGLGFRVQISGSLNNQPFDVPSFFSPGDVKPMSEVLPGIFLGSVHAAADHAQLKSRGITHILNLVSISSTPPAPLHETLAAKPGPPNPVFGCAALCLAGHRRGHGGGQQRRVPTCATASKAAGKMPTIT